jgi:hypothetical protein
MLPARDGLTVPDFSFIENHFETRTDVDPKGFLSEGLDADDANRGGFPSHDAAGDLMGLSKLTGKGLDPYWLGHAEPLSTGSIPRTCSGAESLRRFRHGRRIPRISFARPNALGSRNLSRTLRRSSFPGCPERHPRLRR